MDIDPDRYSCVVEVVEESHESSCMVKYPLEHQIGQMTHSMLICGLHGHLWVDGILEPLDMVLGHEKDLAPPQMVV